MGLAASRSHWIANLEMLFRTAACPNQNLCRYQSSCWSGHLSFHLTLQQPGTQRHLPNSRFCHGSKKNWRMRFC